MNDDFYCPQCQNFTSSSICDICGSPTDSLNISDPAVEGTGKEQNTYPDELIKKADGGDTDEEMEGMHITGDEHDSKEDDEH